MIGFFVVLAGCTPATKPTSPELQKIALGSCNKQYNDQSYWPTIAASNPDLWIWLGDNIYADTDDMQVMAEKYSQQKNNPHYQHFIAQTPVIGIWDDHDYGMNDGNRTFSKKTASKQQFLQFMDMDNHPTINGHEGIYHSRSYGIPPNQVKIILLDTRTFQDPLNRTAKGQDKNYVIQPNGQLLGDVQWQWLTSELEQSTANINLIASSIQVIAEDHRYEMWANFPNERGRLLDLIKNSKINNPIILSGDRHLSEVSVINWQGQTIYDITASGMTHSFSGNEEYNQHRKGQLVTDESFTTMTIDWQLQLIDIEQIDMSGKPIQKLTIPLQ